MQKEQEVLLMAQQRPEKHKMFQGLTCAESHQLSMDQVTNPDSFQLVVDFVNQQVAEIQIISGVIEDQQNLDTWVHINETALEELWKKLADTPEQEKTDVIVAAYAGGGEQIRSLKDDLKIKNRELNELTDGFSCTLAQYCQERLDGAPLIILGRQLEYSEGYLTTRNGKDRTVIFGSFDRLIDCKRKQEAGVTFHERKKLKQRHATPQEWLNLLTALGLMRQY